MISIPIAVNSGLFKWQLDLFWHGHRYVYGQNANYLAHAVVIRKDEPNSLKAQSMPWSIDVPHTMCDAYFDVRPYLSSDMWLKPLNIQVGLLQIIQKFADDDVLELIDCDMFHFRPASLFPVRADELLVSTIYEGWHLGSLTSNRGIIIDLIGNSGPSYYNGGFVPIIGRARTFRKILDLWIEYHVQIVKTYKQDLKSWWGGMYALQAACEKCKVKMIDTDVCFIPGANKLSPSHHICHYSVDRIFNKKTFPSIDTSKFPDDVCYNIINNWYTNYRKNGL